MAPPMAVHEQPVIAPPANSDTLDHYAAETCGWKGCSSPARYRGRCFKHWREGMAQEQARQQTNQVGQSDEEQRELIARARTNAEGAAALGMSPKSIMAFKKRCRTLGVPTPGERRKANPRPADTTRTANRTRTRVIKASCPMVDVSPAAEVGTDRRTRMAAAVREVLGVLLGLPDPDERASVVLAVSFVVDPAK